MDTPQANDSEDWSRLKRVVATLGVITVPSDVPRTEEGEKFRAETSMENISLKEKQSQEETSNVRQSKKKKRSHKDELRKASRTEKTSHNKGQEIGNSYDELNISNINLWR